MYTCPFKLGLVARPHGILSRGKQSLACGGELSKVDSCNVVHDIVYVSKRVPGTS